MHYSPFFQRIGVRALALADRPVRAFGVVALLLVLGCGSARGQDQGMVISPNEDLRRAAEGMLPELARLSGLELQRPIRIEERSRAQLEAYLLTPLDEDFSPERAAEIGQAYALLGMVPEGMDLRQVLLDVLQEQVSGFYDPDSTALYIMDDQDPALVEPIMIHELVHAVQDQHVPLNELTDALDGNDRLVAAKAAIEGHATLVMSVYLLEQMGGSPMAIGDTPDLSGLGLMGMSLLTAQSPTLAAAPLVLRESLIFPYLGGASLTRALWLDADARVAPFGDRLPRSTEQVLDFSAFLGDEPDEPERLVFDGVPDGTYENDLGVLEIGVMLEELIGPEARPLALGWEADRFVLFGAGPGSSLVWASLWEDVPSRDRVLATLEPALGSLPRPATLEAIELEGRPAMLLRVGDPPRLGVRIGGEPGG